jgi:transposase
MAMSRSTSLEERVRILELAKAGLTDKEITERLGWARRTVCKWRRRGQRGGRQALASSMGRPACGAMGTFGYEIKEWVGHMRQQHPGWGPKTLETEMNLQPQWNNRKRPSRSSLARLLREQGLTRSYQRHSQLPDVQRERAREAHEIWEMDARGHEYVPDVGVIALINLNDCSSRARLLSFPCQVGRKRWQRPPNTEDFQTALRLAFVDWGLPKRLQVDRASSFRGSQPQSPFPTRLHLWLLALGVSLSFGRPHQPTDQAITERSHQLWDNQVLKGQRFVDWYALYHALRQRRDFLNCSLPCASLNHQPPLRAQPNARHSGRLYRPELEAQLLDLEKVYAYLAQGHWFRLVSKVGNISLGGHIYYVGIQWARRQFEIMFDPTSQQISCRDEKGDEVVRKPIQGLSKEHLMGDLAAGINLPAFQLCLPFDWSSQNMARLFETILA